MKNILMKKSLSKIFCFVCMMTCFIGIGNFGVEVRPVDDELIVVFPDQIVTTEFSVTNKTSKRQEFESEVRLPKHWKLISIDFPFELESYNSTIKVVSFIVWCNADTGRYKVTYRVQGREYPSLSDETSIYVIVKDSLDLKSKSEDSEKGR